MAKGNLFQGMARGKVGDVVFYRMNGVQMSRVRNRAPKNPRSVEQMYQRAIIASVMKLYSAGKEIFDHAFQGYTVGEGCMRRFNSINARVLRSQVQRDVNEVVNIDEQVGRVTYPKSLTFVPIINCMISEGTLEQNLFVYTSEPGALPPGSGGNRAVSDRNYQWLFSPVNDNISTSTSINDVLTKYGIYAGDIFTFCFCNINTNDILFQMLEPKMNYSTVYKSYFEWMRLIVKSDIDGALTLSTAKFSDVFDIESNMPNMSFDAGQKINVGMAMKLKTGVKMATTGCIRSRMDVDLRSNSFMEIASTDVYGIASGYLLDAWMNEVRKIGTSELILEGGDEGLVNEQNLLNLDNTPIEEANVDEAPVRRTTRHRGTQNNPE